MVISVVLEKLYQDTRELSGIFKIAKERTQPVFKVLLLQENGVNSSINPFLIKLSKKKKIITKPIYPNLLRLFMCLFQILH